MKSNKINKIVTAFIICIIVILSFLIIRNLILIINCNEKKQYNNSTNVSPSTYNNSL